jgi:hypothetical protein
VIIVDTGIALEDIVQGVEDFGWPLIPTEAQRQGRFRFVPRLFPASFGILTAALHKRYLG